MRSMSGNLMMKMTTGLFIALLMSFTGLAFAADFSITDMAIVSNRMHLRYETDSASYYVVYAGEELEALDDPQAVELEGEAWMSLPAKPASNVVFYVIHQQDRANPTDIDGDGMDDMFELQRSFLNAMNAADGVQDQDNDGYHNALEDLYGTELTNALSHPDLQLEIQDVQVPGPVLQSYKTYAEINVAVNLNCDAQVEITSIEVTTNSEQEIVYTPLAGVVRTLQVPLWAGTNRVIWDGKADGGTPCSNGLYRFTVAATNVIGQTAEPYAPSLRTDGAVVSDAAMSPDAPQFRANEACDLSYSLTNSAALAVMVQQAGTNWDSWIQYRDPGTHTDPWRGRHTRDGTLIDGSFGVSVQACRLPENALAIDRALLTDVEAEIYAIRPVYDQVTTLKYKLNTEADFRFEVESPSGAVSTLFEQADMPSGMYTYVWGGSFTGDSIFSEEGDYTLWLVAQLDDGQQHRCALNVIGR